MQAQEEPELRLSTLPPDLLVRVVSLLSVRDLARIDCTAHAFHSVPVTDANNAMSMLPQRCVVEDALRLRAAITGRTVPVELPRREKNWTQALLFREKLREDADQPEAAARAFVGSQFYTQLNTRACEEYLASSIRVRDSP